MNPLKQNICPQHLKLYFCVLSVPYYLFLIQDSLVTKANKTKQIFLKANYFSLQI
mgnify:CR=1 FL=1